MFHVSRSIALLTIALLGLPATASVAETQVQRGEYLARAGDCSACHTQAGGPAFAGGSSVHSPFGSIYAPNITPDKDTGIGSWSDDDFYRALHDGVGKGGKLLYPAMPYPNYTKVTRDDVLAIKAYLFSLPPVRRENKETKLRFPFDIRTGLSAWNLAFFKPGEFKPEPGQSSEYNRGAYLVQGLGHCGDCHTPRGYMMEPLTARAFSGGVVDNWYASNITSDKARGIGDWSSDELFQYLKTGLYRDKGPIVGPMAQVVHESLSYLSDDDLRAIVTYVKSIKPVADYKPETIEGLADPHSAGETAYLNHCAFCHGLDGEGRAGAFPALAGNNIVQAKGPETVIRIVLGGLLARGTFGPMPAVGQEMTDEEIADAVNFARNAWGNAAPATANSGLVAKIRDETYGLLAMRPSPNDRGDPCRSGDDATPVPQIDDPQGQIASTVRKVDEMNMEDSIGRLVARMRQIAPKASQSEIINGLSEAYCHVQIAAGAPTQKGRRLLNRFAQLVYTELVSPPLAKTQASAAAEGGTPPNASASQPSPARAVARHPRPRQQPTHYYRRRYYR